MADIEARRRIALRFHAAGPEAMTMLSSWAKEFGLIAVLGRLFDDRHQVVRAADFDAALTAVPRPDFVLLSRRPVQLSSGMNLYRLMQANDGVLYLHLGQHGDGGLRESHLSFAGTDPADLELWRKLISRARRSMRSGAVITNPMTQATSYDRSHRYTGEALRLQATGVTMLAGAGWNTFRLGPGSDPPAGQERTGS